MRTSEASCLSSDMLEGIAAGSMEPEPPIQHHLSECSVCRQALTKIREDNHFLSRFAINGALPAVVAIEESQAQIEIPGYRIVREIHRGGQGVVYLAVQRSTQRDVAIKVMKQGPFATMADRTRFDREIEVLAKLEHPNIVTVHDAGVTAGCHYFVMAYVEGNPLDEASSALELEQRLEVFIKICEAVHAAHLRGIIHRDLKPSNIRVDSSGEPHVLDFGLAKPTDPQIETDLTQTGQFVGSLPWASPEQVEGIPSKIDLRTDVYSLGAILYQMLSGALPIDVSGNLRDAVDRILQREPVVPSSVALQNTSRQTFSAKPQARIDGELDTIVLKALAKDPARRYQSAGDLARDLRRHLAGEPIEARRDSAWYVIRKTAWRKRRVLFAALVPILLLPIVAAALYHSASAARQAAQERRLRELESQRNAAILEITRRVQARPGSPAESPGGRLNIFNADAIHSDLESGNLAVSDYSVAMLLAESMRDRGSIKPLVQAEGLVRQAIHILSSEQGPKHPEIGKLRTVLADILLRRGTRMPEAQQAATIAVQELTDAFGPSSPETARATIVLARIKLARNDSTGAMTAANSALASDHVESSTHLIEAQALQASILAQQGQLAEARRTYLTSARAMLRKVHDTDARLLDMLELGASMIDRKALPAEELFDPACRRDALATIQPAAALREVAAVLRGGADGTERDNSYIPARFIMIGLRERLLGPKDPSLGTSLASAASSQLAELWRGEKSDEKAVSMEAEALLRRAIPLQIEAHGPDSIMVGKSYDLLATCLRHTYRLREATQWFIKDCELWTRQPPELRDEFQIMLRSRWTAWHAVRASLCDPDEPAAKKVAQFQLGLQWSSKAIERINQTIGPEHAGNALMYACQAVCLAGLGRRSDSLESEKKALEVLSGQPVPEDQTKECDRFLGAARLINGRTDEARAILEPAWKRVQAKPENDLEILEWSRTMLTYCRMIGDKARMQQMATYIRDHGYGDITSASAPSTDK